jgi:cytochrome c-type biogenesis protein CcmE
MGNLMTQEISSVSIPAQLGAKPERKFNSKYLVGGAILLTFVGLLAFQMINATMTTGAYYMTVAEIQHQTPTLEGQRVRVNGNVVIGSEDWNAEAVTLKFKITDDTGAQLPIVFNGPRPDNFQRAASAIVEGELLPDGSFQAETLLLKCPSRYEEEPEEVFVKAKS